MKFATRVAPVGIVVLVVGVAIGLGYVPGAQADTSGQPVPAATKAVPAAITVELPADLAVPAAVLGSLRSEPGLESVTASDFRAFGVSGQVGLRKVLLGVVKSGTRCLVNFAEEHATTYGLRCGDLEPGQNVFLIRSGGVHAPGTLSGLAPAAAKFVVVTNQDGSSSGQIATNPAGPGWAATGFALSWPAGGVATVKALDGAGLVVGSATIQAIATA